MAFSKLEDAKKIKNLLNRNGYNDILACNSASQVIAAANENDGGIVLCGYRLPDMHYRELYGYLPREFRMLLAASPARLQECTSGDIMCLSMPFHIYELVNTIETMMLDLPAEQKKTGAEETHRAGTAYHRGRQTASYGEKSSLGNRSS